MYRYQSVNVTRIVNCIVWMYKQHNMLVFFVEWLSSRNNAKPSIIIVNITFQYDSKPIKNGSRHNNKHL